MESAVIVSQQIMMMFILIIVGVVARKKEIFTKEAGKCLSNFLLHVGLPSVIISSMYRPKTEELLKGLGLAYILSLVVFALSVVVSHILIPKRGDGNHRFERFAIIFTNSSFMAIPLIRATLGEVYTFYTTAFLAWFFIFQWSDGVIELGGKINPKKLLKNSCLIAIVIAIAIFWFQIPMPTPVMMALSSLSTLTTPVSLLVAGIFLADLKIKELFSFRLFYTAFISNLLLPLAFTGLFILLGVSNWFPGANMVCLVLIYCSACPSAVSMILMSSSMDLDALYPGKIVAVTTALAVITLPLIAAISDKLLM